MIHGGFLSIIWLCKPYSGFVPDEKQTSESSERKKVLFSFLYLQFVDRLESISNQAREKEKAM